MEGAEMAGVWAPAAAWCRSAVEARNTAWRVAAAHRGVPKVWYEVVGVGGSLASGRQYVRNASEQPVVPEPGKQAVLRGWCAVRMCARVRGVRPRRPGRMWNNRRQQHPVRCGCHKCGKSPRPRTQAGYTTTTSGSHPPIQNLGNRRHHCPVPVQTNTYAGGVGPAQHTTN